MHPILASRARLILYLVAWTPLAAGLAAGLVLAGGFQWPGAVAIAAPAALVYAFVCLAPWYLCRAVPIAAANIARLLFTWLAASLVSSFIWLLAIELGVVALASASPGADVRLGRGVAAVVLAMGVLLFLLAAALHYLGLAIERSREAETRALELRVLAREAELRALRRQIDPHFLFNSLNSISALTAADPAGARHMCLLLSEFLRLSLKLGARERITLGEEVALVERFLGIEQVRFADRLRAIVTLEPGAERCAVPPLLLQPIVENAVRHGVAELVEGGTIEVRAARHGDRLAIRVENPCDADRRGRAGAGVGLANVRSRLATAFGADAHVDAAEHGGVFRVDVTLPAGECGEDAAPAAGKGAS